MCMFYKCVIVVVTPAHESIFQSVESNWWLLLLAGLGSDACLGVSWNSEKMLNVNEKKKKTIERWKGDPGFEF